MGGAFCFADFLEILLKFVHILDGNVIESACTKPGPCFIINTCFSYCDMSHEKSLFVNVTVAMPLKWYLWNLGFINASWTKDIIGPKSPIGVQQGSDVGLLSFSWERMLRMLRGSLFLDCCMRYAWKHLHLLCFSTHLITLFLKICQRQKQNVLFYVVSIIKHVSDGWVCTRDHVTNEAPSLPPLPKRCRRALWSGRWNINLPEFMMEDSGRGEREWERGRAGRLAGEERDIKPRHHKRGEGGRERKEE